MPKVFNRVAYQTLVRTYQKMNGVLHCVQKLVQRFCFWPKIFRLAVHQAMVQMHQKMNVTLRSKIGTQILIFAKSFQEGRVPEFGTNVPKNERYITFKNWHTNPDFGQNFSGGPCAKLWHERAKK